VSNAPVEPPVPINPTPANPPIFVSPPIVFPPVVVPPIEPLTPTAPATPGMPFGFTVTLNDSSGQAGTASSGTVTLALVNNPGGTTLTVTTQDGVDTFSGLTLKKHGNGSGYALIAHSGRQTASAHGTAAVASTRPIRIATEEVLTAGKGKDKHVVGFEIDLGKALDPTVARDVANRTVPRTARQTRETVTQSVNLLVDYNSSAGSASLMLTGKAKIARGGQIVVVARS
jgi:hypothetical protein